MRSPVIALLLAGLLSAGPAFCSETTERAPRLTLSIPPALEDAPRRAFAQPPAREDAPRRAFAQPAMPQTSAQVEAENALRSAGNTAERKAAGVQKEAPPAVKETPGRDSTLPRLELPAGQSVLDFPDSEVSLELKDMDIIEALKYIAEKASINIIPTKEIQGRVSLNVSGVSVKDVFEIVLRSNNLAYVKQGNIYNVMTQTEYKTRYGKDFYDSRITKVFRLQYAVPDQALGLLNTLKSEIGKVLLDAESGVILAMDTPEKIREMQAALDAMDRKGIIRVFNLKYARAKDIEDQLKNQLDIKKVGSIKSDERTNQVIVQTLPERMEDISRLISGLDQKTRQILIDAKVVQVKLNNEMSTGIRWEGLFDIGNQKSGLSYLGSTPFSSVQAATDPWRSRLDTYNDGGKQVGSYGFSGTTTSNNGSQPKVGTQEMHLGMINKNNDFDVVLKYLQTLGETRILSNPKLAVVNNQEAKIHVGERRAYITTTTTQTQTSTTVAEAVTYVDVGIQLVITPTINEDGYVTVKIKPEISSVIDYLKTSSNNSIPIIDTSTAETIVMVKDGTSLLIGGLSKEDKTLDQSGTPILSKIPLIGELFKQSTKKTVRYELMVLLTPHVVSGDELVTGSSHDLGYKLDKEFQDYRPLDHEVKDPAGAKDYQTYQALPAKGSETTGSMPGLKPEQTIQR